MFGTWCAVYILELNIYHPSDIHKGNFEKHHVSFKNFYCLSLNLSDKQLGDDNLISWRGQTHFPLIEHSFSQVATHAYFFSAVLPPKLYFSLSHTLSFKFVLLNYWITIFTQSCATIFILKSFAPLFLPKSNGRPSLVRHTRRLKKQIYLVLSYSW